MRNFKKVILGAALSMVCTVAFAQQLTVKGVVKQPDGETVIGATVTEKGTTNATVTDLDGNFTLAVKSGAELVISYIGFNTVTTAAKPQMDITLSEDAKVIDEVVVTGYTTQRKADLTGAVSVVSVTYLQKQNENNPMKALQGRVPGMNISADGSPSGVATVRIRGIGTLNNNDPLYIIDGVPTKAGMHELNGNDIESIQILKDAASASIYGSRAANGVIIITTKKGKDGKLKVDLDASIAASMYSHKMDVLNAKEFGQVMWQGYVNDGMDPNTNGLGYHYDWGYNAQGQAVLNGITMKKYLDDAGTTPAADTDWYDLTTRTGVIQNYNVSVSNGSQKGSSFFSLGYYKNLGIIKTSDFERFSARFNTEYKLIGDKLTIGEHFTLNRTSEVAAPGGFLQNVLQFNPSLPVYTTDGSYAGPVGGYPDRYNPVAVLERNKDNRYTYWRTFGDAYVNLNLFKGFNLRSTFGLDYSQKQQRIFTYPVTEGNVANKTNAVEAKQEHWTKWMWNAVATYNLELGQHRMDAMVGMELNREDDNYFSGRKEDYIILSPDYMWPDAGTGTAQAYGSGEGYSLVSFFENIPFVMNPNLTIEDYNNLSNTEYTNDEGWQLIINDLEDAYKALPVKQKEVGRPSKAAAAAFLTKVYLYKAYHQDNAQSNEVTSISADDLKKVVEYSDPSIYQAGGFDLEADFHNNFRPEAQYENGVESIWAIQYSMNDGTKLGNLNWSYGLIVPNIAGVTDGGCDFYKPSQNMVNAFRTNAEGLPLLDTFNDKDYDKAADYADPRLFLTVGIPGLPYEFNSNYMMDETDTWSRSHGLYGYYVTLKQNVDPDCGYLIKGSWWGTPENRIVFRYADVLLERAEALVQLNDGRIDEAISLVNKLRTRAKQSMSVISNYETDYGVRMNIATYKGSYDQAQALKIVKMERRVEMGMESERFFDLVRWGEAAEVLNKYYAEEADACNWMLQNVPNSLYVSFDAIKNGSVDLSECKLMWWHQ